MADKNNGLWMCANLIKAGQFADEYILGDIIGRGASSTVHKCLWKGRSEWACKVLKKKKLCKDLVQKEIPILKSLKHPGIVMLKDVFETDDEIRLVLELMRGGELFERIIEKGCYSERVASCALSDVLKALEYLHDNGIIHRDIKPENLLYESIYDNSVLKIADFGLSRNVPDCSNLMTTVCGTLGYCAPEVLKNAPYDFLIDMWSVGVVMYIMLCGCEPFRDRRGEASVTQKIIEGDFTFYSPHWDTISPSAKDLLSRLLSVNPMERPTAKDALNHPWIQGLTSPECHMPETVILLRNFNAKRKFKGATAAVIALNSLKRSASVECF